MLLRVIPFQIRANSGSELWGTPLAHDQHFPHVVPREKELDRSKIAEEILDVTVVEYPLQLEAVGDRGMDDAGGSASCFPAEDNALHLERVLADDMEAIARGVRR